MHVSAGGKELIRLDASNLSPVEQPIIMPQYVIPSHTFQIHLGLNLNHVLQPMHLRKDVPVLLGAKPRNLHSVVLSYPDHT